MSITLLRYQKQGSAKAYKVLVFWDSIGMLVGTVGLLGTAPA